MQKRTSHKKSRRGCISCKKKHVKCDEQGPPCANCTIRKTPCVYPPLSQSKKTPPRSAKTPAINVSQVDSSSSSDSTSSSSSSNEADVTRLVTTPGSSITNFSSIGTTNRLLELELMHRWSTRTWQGMYAVPECQAFLQYLVPQLALRNGYLMNGIFALAAVDLAMCSKGTESMRYSRSALEFSNRASAAYRDELQRGVTADNSSLLCQFSMMASISNFAISAGDRTALDRITVAFDMALGCFNIGAVNWSWLLDGPTSAQAMITKYPTDLELMDTIDPDTKAGIQRISTVSRLVRLPPTGDPTLDSDGLGPIANDVWGYKLAVGQTKYCFAEYRVKGYFQSIMTISGPVLTKGVHEREPMALFIVMYMGVLMQRESSDPMMWWLTSSGRDLVAEISELLVLAPIADLEGAREGIAWCKHQVGLAPLAGCQSDLISTITELV